MGTVSGSGSNSTTDAMLATIMKRLDAMDEKLKGLNPIRDKVTSLEAATDQLGNQQVTMMAAVERVDITHTVLNTRLNRVEGGHRAPVQDRPPHHGRGRQGDNDAKPGGDILQTSHRLAFPKYDGNGDPLPWLNRCERYFHVRQTPENKSIAFTAFYLLDDAQLWFHLMELNGGSPTWNQFVKLVNARFRPPLTDNPIGELAMLRRTGTVDEFSKLFIALSYHDTSLTEPLQIQLFITGLGDPLHTDVALQQPSTLDDAVIFARAYKQSNASRECIQPSPTRDYSRQTAKGTSPTLALPAPGATGETTPTTVLRLTPAEIAQRRKGR
jgi:hypothetical protein